jgi:hypothetical protein
VVFLPPSVPADEYARVERLRGLVTTDEGVYVVGDLVEQEGIVGRRRVWLIDRGLERAGFYMGGAATITVY